MSFNWALVVDAVRALAWPLIAALGLYVLRQPLRELVAQLARRATKLSVFDVSIELATLPELHASWSVGDTDLRQLTSSRIFDSTPNAMFQELLKPAKSDYAIVDLRSGGAWLTSRLFLFAVILGEVTGLRAFVFLETTPSVRRRFLGVATPGAVRRQLGARYPWFEEAFARALEGAYPRLAVPAAAGLPAFTGNAPPLTPGDGKGVEDFVNRFLQALQRSSPPPPKEMSSHLEIGTSPPNWERTRWLDAERLEGDLASALEQTWVEFSPDHASATVRDGVLRRDAPFVALVDPDRRFVGLVDRGAMLRRMALQALGRNERSEAGAAA